jgi:pimeloyl-ACP methyl ester carboxylesterase
MMRKLTLAAMALVFVPLFTAALNTQKAIPSTQQDSPDVMLKPCHIQGVKEEVRCGIYNVFENRKTRKGRMLPLKIVLLPAKRPHPNEGPIFYMAGGPGETATELANLMIEFGDAEDHDVVLVDERGTGEGHRLDCRSSGSDDNVESYLSGPFDPVAARSCRDELEREYDLTQYSTPNFVEDIDEVRRAMGYEKINLSAGSFGTYAALIYMRWHPDHVRTAYLKSLTPLSDRVPLYFPEAAQLALDELFKECEKDSQCYAAYPKSRDDFASLLEKLRTGPVLSSVRHPVTGAQTEVHLTERAFGDALRLMMYHNPYEIPFLLEQAKAGNFSPFAEEAVRVNRGIYSGGRMGLHYAITCNEFVSRIRPEEVEAATRGTFLGSWRVRDQMEVCQDWPKTELPADYYEPFRLEMPTVVVSTEADPASSSGRWDKEVTSTMPNAVHVTVSGVGHPTDNKCLRAIRHALFRSGTTKNLDTNCVAKLQRPPFKLRAH